MDALKLLGSLLGNNATSSGPGGQILGQLLDGLTRGGVQSSGAGGGLTDLLGSLTRSSAQSGGAGGGLTDLLGSLTKGGAQSSGAGGGLADLLGSLTGGVRPQGSAAPGGSNMAGVLGSLAMIALQMFSQRGAASGQSSLAALALTDAASGQTPPAVDAAQAHQQALAFIKAMINAAKADGQIDQEEMQRIAGKIGEDGVSAEEKQMVMEELRRPLDLAGLVAEVPNAAVASQVYGASLLAINVDTEQEASYLRSLAAGLKLDPATVARLHELTGAPKV